MTNTTGMKHMNRRIILCLVMLMGLIALTASARPVPEQSSDEREFVGPINNTLGVRIKLSQSGKSLQAELHVSHHSGPERAPANVAIASPSTHQQTVKGTSWEGGQAELHVPRHSGPERAPARSN